MSDKRVICIADLLPKPVEVEVSDGVFLPVEALNLQQIVSLAWKYQDAFLSVYAAGLSGEPNYSSLLATSPHLVADIIACGTGAEGQEADILRLPATVQLIALASIWKMSVPDPKKLQEVLTEVFASLQRLNKEKAALDSPPLNPSNPTSESQ